MNSMIIISQARTVRAISSYLKRNISHCLVIGDMMNAGSLIIEQFHNQHDNPFTKLMALPTRSSSSMSNLKDDLESDNTFQFIDDRMKSRLYNSYSTLPSDHDAQKLRSQLPLELNLSSLGVLSKEKVKRKLPPMQEVEKDEVSEEYYAQALPRSINQITSQKLDEDHRPIVITSTKNPFRIVAVNTAWENLCGYSRDECMGISVGRLLQGPETDMSKTTALLSKLLIGEEAGTVLTNYTKQGKKFKNNIRVGPIYNEMGKTVNFVGVLREMKDDDKENGCNNVSVEGKRQLPFMA